jgi:hypothetical protein
VTPSDAVDFLSTELAKRRYVCRNWRAFGTADERFVSIEFLFMCPCGRNVRERINICMIGYDEMEFDCRVRDALPAIVRELESHLREEETV